MGADVRLPPQDLDAERSLLGAMMLDRETVGLALQIIPRDECERLYRPDHQKLYKMLIDVYDEGHPMDIIVVRDELHRRSLLDEVGGVEYLTELVNSVPSADNVEHYARIVRDKSLLRQMIRVCSKLQDQCFSSTEQVAKILDTAEKELFAVTEQRVKKQAVALRQILEMTMKQIQEGTGHYLTGLSSGFLELDDLTSGFQPGELIIIAARPSMGKTAFGMCIAAHAAIEENKAVAFFSLEMGAQQIVQRLLCMRGRVDSHKMRRGMLNEEDKYRITDAAGDLENKPFYIDDTPGMSVMELRAKARRLKHMHDIQAIYVDYLQLMRDPETAGESRQHEVATISRGLKALARELNLPVLALAQLNRNPEGREGNKPRMSDLRESGAIEQDADMIMLLHREEYYKKNDPEVANKAQIIIAKQRNGPVGEVDLHFDHRYTRFDNLHVGSAPNYVPEHRAPAYNADGPGLATADEEATPY